MGGFTVIEALLLLAVLVPGLGYFALLVLLLGRPVHWGIDRLLVRSHRRPG